MGNMGGFFKIWEEIWEIWEIGRQKRPKVPVEERLCRCGNGVETEEHFLRDCNMYTHIRHKYDINQETELSHILDSNITFDYVTELHDCREIYANSWIHIGPMKMEMIYTPFVCLMLFSVWLIVFTVHNSIRSIRITTTTTI